LSSPPGSPITVESERGSTVVATVERVKIVLDSKTADRAVKFIALLSLLLALLVGFQQYRLSNCLAGYADQYNAVAVQRGQAQQTSTDAIDAFVRAAVESGRKPSTTARQMAFQQAYEAYITARATADEQRKLNPLPEPPKERC
jgi:hypothetical protein